MISIISKYNLLNSCYLFLVFCKYNIFQINFLILNFVVQLSCFFWTVSIKFIFTLKNSSTAEHFKTKDLQLLM